MMVSVGFITPSISRRSGGIFEIQRRLSQELYKLADTEVRVFGLHDEYSDVDLESWLPIVPSVYRHIGPSAFRFSPELTRSVVRSDCDVMHLHVLWMATSLVCQAWYRRRSRPYIVTVNGMLEPWALRNSYWKKVVARYAFEQKNLRNAACLVVNSENEFRSVRALGLKNPIAIIPNGVDMPLGAFNQCDKKHISERDVASLTNTRGGDRRKTLLYIGRLHPKKGLANLLKAWQQSKSTLGVGNRASWRLVIAGWDELSHEADLKRIGVGIGLKVIDLRESPSVKEVESADVLFLGPQFGDRKDQWLRSCDAFVLPSFSEGLPMAVLEAWAYAKPVLMTPHCNIPEGFDSGAAIRIDATEDSICDGLKRLAFSSEEELRSIGSKGFTLVSEKFTWHKIAVQVRDVSQWVMYGGTPPEIVRID